MRLQSDTDFAPAPAAAAAVAWPLRRNRLRFFYFFFADAGEKKRHYHREGVGGERLRLLQTDNVRDKRQQHLNNSEAASSALSNRGVIACSDKSGGSMSTC